MPRYSSAERSYTKKIIAWDGTARATVMDLTVSKSG